MRVDICSICINFVYSRTGYVSSVGSEHTFANRFVITIKQVVKIFIKGNVPLDCFWQKECFKKPACMCEMPLRWRDVNRGLNDIIFGLQWFANFFCTTSNRQKPLLQIDLFLGCSKPLCCNFFHKIYLNAVTEFRKKSVIVF